MVAVAVTLGSVTMDAVPMIWQPAPIIFPPLLAPEIGVVLVRLLPEIGVVVVVVIGVVTLPME